MKLSMLPIIALLAAPALAAEPTAPAIIPLPQSVESREGSFNLGPKRASPLTPLPAETAQYLAERLRKATGYSLKLATSTEPQPASGQILLTTARRQARAGAGRLRAGRDHDSVVVRAADSGGLFYGVQSLLELLPPEVFAAKPVAGVDWKIPCVQIEDQPRFKWRGFMLDVARHFFTKDEVKQMLDVLALHKLNTFHLHLTDDQGWRIEIKKYPRLTQVGAWRKEAGFGLDPKASTTYGPDGRYGGYLHAGRHSRDRGLCRGEAHHGRAGD